MIVDEIGVGRLGLVLSVYSDNRPRQEVLRMQVNGNGQLRNVNSNGKH